jgi:hypothetical protein
MGRLAPRPPEDFPAQPPQGRQPSFSPQPGPQRYDDPWQDQYAPPPPPRQYAPAVPRWQDPPPAYRPAYGAASPVRKKRRIFLWVFLAIQVLFVILIIVQVAAHPAGPTAAQQAAQTCAHGGWYPLFKSQADCDQHYAVALNDAGNVGKGLGVAAIVIGWMVTDFFLGLGYGIYRLASRR